MTNDDLQVHKNKDFDTTSDNEKDKDSESDKAQNNSLKKIRNRQKNFNLIQIVAEPKYRNLTEDKKNFLARIGHYARYSLQPNPYRNSSSEDYGN